MAQELFTQMERYARKVLGETVFGQFVVKDYSLGSLMMRPSGSSRPNSPFL
jgi:hypothetical protein